MEIVYTSHAVDRMRERKITPAAVETVLSAPDGTIQQSRDKTIFYKRIKGRSDNSLAAVALRRANDSYDILTVMIYFEAKS